MAQLKREIADMPGVSATGEDDFGNLLLRCRNETVVALSRRPDGDIEAWAYKPGKTWDECYARAKVGGVTGVDMLKYFIGQVCALVLILLPAQAQVDISDLVYRPPALPKEAIIVMEEGALVVYPAPAEGTAEYGVKPIRFERSGAYITITVDGYSARVPARIFDASMYSPLGDSDHELTPGILLVP